MTPPLIGTTETELVGHFATRGSGTLVLLGDPGTGKSTLLDVAVAAAPPGTTVLRTAGTEFEADLPFAVLDVLLHPLLDLLATLRPSSRGPLSVALGLAGGSPPDREAVAGAVLELLVTRARTGPVLVVADDLQWADRASATVLGALARRLAGTPVRLLGAQRLGEDSAFDRAGLPVHEIAALDDERAAALVSAAHPRISAPVLRRVLAAAQGNPLVLLELPGALTPGQLRGAEPLPQALPLGPRLEHLFSARIEALPSGGRRALLLVALEATGRLDVLSRATGGSWDTDLAQAEHRRLVRIDVRAGRLGFLHPVVRSTVVELSTAAERQEGHRRLAEVVVDPDRRTWHLAAAAPGPDGAIAGLLDRVAQRALDRGDPAGAVVTLLRAAELAPDRTGRAARLARAAYLGAALTGDLPGASQLLTAARRGDPGLAGSLDAALTSALLAANVDGDVPRAHAEIARGIDARGAVLDASEPAVVEALHDLTDLSSNAHREDLWAVLESLLARVTPPVPAVVRARASVLADPVRAPASALAVIDEQVRTLAGESDPRRVFRIGNVAFVADRSHGCLDALRRIVAEAREREGVARTPALRALSGLCWHDFLAGRWDESERANDEGTAIAQRLGHTWSRWVLDLAHAAVSAGRGDHGTVEVVTDALLGAATPQRAGLAVELARFARSLSAMGRRDLDAAYREASAVTPPGRVPALTVRFSWFVLDLVESAVGTGRIEEAAAHARAVHDVGMARLSPRAAMIATAARALTAPDDVAADLFQQAVGVPGADRWAFEHARVQLLLGEHLRRRHAPLEARGHLLAAGAVFDRLGAAPWADRVAGELRASGLGDPGSASALTPQELQVAGLAASGLSNRQIAERMRISPRTVGAHLYRVFPKLGVSSRAGLRDALGS